jgi:lipoate-protein ligase A
MNNIPIARRLTGGGTVYHDQGNINFTFIRQGEPGKLVDFGGFIAPVISFLKKMGIEAIPGQKNEILVNGKKISGNAEHVYKNRILHHGTLLYNADLERLRESIKLSTGRYFDRAVQSNRSSVMNLIDCINPVPSIHDFCESFLQDVQLNFMGKPYTPCEEEQTAIQQLAAEKYKSWEWVFGWSPDYDYHRDYRTGNIGINIDLSAHRGIITRCMLRFTVFPRDSLEVLAAKLTGTPHEENNIRSKLTECGLKDVVNKKDFEDLVLSFFD